MRDADAGLLAMLVWALTSTVGVEVVGRCGQLGPAWLLPHPGPGSGRGQVQNTTDYYYMPP